MITKTVLTDEEIIALGQQAHVIDAEKNGYILPIAFARAIEQAVLQSPEVQALRKDAERYRWLRDGNGYYPEENYLRGGVELDDGVDLAMEQQI